MKRFLGVSAGLLAMAWPCLAQLPTNSANLQRTTFGWQDRDDDHRRDRDDDRDRGWRARLSDKDQGRFNSYYSRWLQYRSQNNRGEIESMEKRMNDIYNHYGIPLGTPYGSVATNGGGYNEDRGYGRDHDADDRGRDNGRWGDDHDRRYENYRGRLSSKDQGRFDSYYQRWLGYRAQNNTGEMASMQKRMDDIYNHYGIPIGTPYGSVASNGRY